MVPKMNKLVRRRLSSMSSGACHTSLTAVELQPEAHRILGPLITICGTTGVGKSNLAIELALQLSRGSHKYGWKGARIINADAMQVYEGMDIITNKVPEMERQGIEHLLMGFKQPGEQYVVGQWVQDAMKVIEGTHKKNEIPIVVGGTSYWIQHLMFPNRLAQENSPSDKSSSDPPLMSEELAKSIAALPPHLLKLFNALPEHPPSAAVEPEAAFSLHSVLSTIDPIVAARWHWRDTRKVLRSLCIVKETGRRTSEILTEQSQGTVKPRYRSLCFWLYAEPSILESRLNARVDKMIEQGLLHEILSLRQLATSAQRKEESTFASRNGSASDIKVDYTLGIYQSIGYKEFHNYLSSPSPSEKAFDDAVDNVKAATRKYAKRQIYWIRNKLLPAVYLANEHEMFTSIYVLDATELGDKWMSNVRNPAVQISQDFLDCCDLPDPFCLSNIAREMLSINPKSIDPVSVLNARRKIICSVCTVNKDQPLMIEEGREWDAHQKTRIHKRLVGKASRDLVDKEHRAVRKQRDNSEAEDNVDDMLLFS